MLLVEKYRPKEFKDVIGIDPNIEKCLENMPHLLLIGSPGTGKTTTSKIIISKLKADTLILNASSERGINVVREKILSFASTQSTNGKYKIVFLDEFDYTTAEFQTALRNLMETYHSNVRFICTANYENKIIDALKSRLVMFRFGTVDDEALLVHLAVIANKEGIKVESDVVLKRLIEVNKTDIRKCVNTLQRWAELGRIVKVGDVKEDDILPEQVHNLLKVGEFIKCRQLLLDSNIEYDVFLDSYHSFVVDLCLNKKLLPAKQFASIIESLTNAIIHINQVINKEIIVENFLFKVMKGLKE